MVAPRQSQVTHQDPSVYELLDPGNCLPRSTVTWKFFNFLLHGHAQAVARQDPPQGRHIDTLTQSIARQGLPWYGGFPTFYFMITVGFPFLQPDAQRHKYSIKWGGKTEFTICGMAVNSCGARKLRGYSPSACCAPVTRPLVALGSSPELLAFTMLLPPPVRQCVAWFLLRWGWVFLERTRILSGIQLTSHFIINFCVVETKRFVSSTVNVILMRQTCGQRSSRAAESKHRALGNYFSEWICFMLLISKCRGDWDLGLCTTLGLAFGEPQHNGKIREKNVFRRRKNRILPLCWGLLTESAEVVHKPRSRSPLHFDIRNI